MLSSPAMAGEWLMVVLGTPFVIGGFVWARHYWRFWKEGVEANSTIVKLVSSQLGDNRFQDQAAQEHLIVNTTPPRYGQFVVGRTRRLTYLPWDPTKWEWGRPVDQRFYVFLGIYLMAIGVGLAVAGLKPYVMPKHEEPGYVLPHIPKLPKMPEEPPAAPN